MKYLGYRQTLWIYKRIVEETGGSPGIRDEGLLRSALARPQTTFGGQDLYPTLFEKTAALAESLVRNHPFVDGNKRMALACLRVMLKMNGYQVSVPQDAKVDLVRRIVLKELTVQDVSEWLAKHSRRSPNK